jgi:hypothetical protein
MTRTRIKSGADHEPPASLPAMLGYGIAADTLGGGYFFLPGMKALEFVARHRRCVSRPLRPR